MGVLDGSMKLTMSQNCNSKLVNLIDKCFSKNPEERPTFQAIFDDLSRL